MAVAIGCGGGCHRLRRPAALWGSGFHALALALCVLSVLAARAAGAAEHSEGLAPASSSGPSQQQLRTNNGMTFLQMPLTWREDSTLSPEERARRLRLRQPRRLQARELGEDNTPFDEVPAFGDASLGYYYVDIFLGTPPQKATVIFDTGSGLTALPCKGCPRCGKHMDPKFDFSLSSTNHPLMCSSSAVHCGTCHSGQCGYSISYTEGSSLRGDFYTDQVWLGYGDGRMEGEEEHFAVDYTFGCHTLETNLFVTQDADGIMGASPRPSAPADTLIEKLWSTGKITHHMFSLCIHEEGGILAMGGYDSGIHNDPSAAVKYVGYSGGYYTIHGDSWMVGGTRVSGTGSFSFIVDSGTTFSYFSYSRFNAIYSSFKTYCAASSSHCQGTATTHSGENGCYHNPKLSTFPTITIMLSGGLALDLMPAVYLSQAWSPDGSPDRDFCMGMYGDPDNVLGANLMKNHNVIFDIQNRRLGFAPANCDGGDIDFQMHQNGEKTTTTSTTTSTTTAAATTSTTTTSTTTRATTTSSTTSASSTTVPPTTSTTTATASTTSIVDHTTAVPAGMTTTTTTIAPITTSASTKLGNVSDDTKLTPNATTTSTTRGPTTTTATDATAATTEAPAKLSPSPSTAPSPAPAPAPSPTPSSDQPLAPDAGGIPSDSRAVDGGADAAGSAWSASHSGSSSHKTEVTVLDSPEALAAALIAGAGVLIFLVVVVVALRLRKTKGCCGCCCDPHGKYQRVEETHGGASVSAVSMTAMQQGGKGATRIQSKTSSGSPPQDHVGGGGSGGGEIEIHIETGEEGEEYMVDEEGNVYEDGEVIGMWRYEPDHPRYRPEAEANDDSKYQVVHETQLAMGEEAGAEEEDIDLGLEDVALESQDIDLGLGDTP